MQARKYQAYYSRDYFGWVVYSIKQLEMLKVAGPYCDKSQADEEAERLNRSGD